MPISFEGQVVKILRDYVNIQHKGNISAACRAMGLASHSDLAALSRCLNAYNPLTTREGRIPRLDTISRFMDKLGVQVTVTNVAPSTDDSPTKQQLDLIYTSLTKLVQQLEAFQSKG